MQKPGRIAPRLYLDMDEKRRKTVGAIRESPLQICKKFVLAGTWRQYLLRRFLTAYDKNTFMTSMTSSRVSKPEMEMMRLRRYLIVLSETCRISAMSKYR